MDGLLGNQPGGSAAASVHTSRRPAAWALMFANWDFTMDTCSFYPMRYPLLLYQCRIYFSKMRGGPVFV